MADTRVSVDCATGAATERALTPAEQAALDAFRSGQATLHTARQAADANAGTIRQAARDALATNKAFAALAKPATAAAQASAAFDAAQRMARQQNGLIRLLLGVLDATD